MVVEIFTDFIAECMFLLEGLRQLGVRLTFSHVRHALYTSNLYSCSYACYLIVLLHVTLAIV